jgi:hypothetical protein
LLSHPPVSSSSLSDGVVAPKAQTNLFSFSSGRNSFRRVLRTPKQHLRLRFWTILEWMPWNATLPQ